MVYARLLRILSFLMLSEFDYPAAVSRVFSFHLVCFSLYIHAAFRIIYIYCGLVGGYLAFIFFLDSFP